MKEEARQGFSALVVEQHIIVNAILE